MVSFLTDTVVCGFSLYHILAYFLIYSCIGWCLEVIYAAATTGQQIGRACVGKECRSRWSPYH